jgi:hypothetical protein
MFRSVRLLVTAHLTGLSGEPSSGELFNLIKFGMNSRLRFVAIHLTSHSNQADVFGDIEPLALSVVGRRSLAIDLTFDRWLQRLHFRLWTNWLWKNIHHGDSVVNSSTDL